MLLFASRKQGCSNSMRSLHSVEVHSAAVQGEVRLPNEICHALIQSVQIVAESAHLALCLQALTTSSSLLTFSTISFLRSPALMVLQ